MSEYRAMPGPTFSEPLCISEFLRSRHAEIVGEWERRVRELPIARQLERPRLLDHIPKLLLQMADLIEATKAGEISDDPLGASYIHALERLDEGYDLSSVVREYNLLRRCILNLIERELERHASQPSELTILNEAIDQAVTAAVSRFASARHRTLEALDRVSTVALASDDLDGFLGKLQEVVLQTTEAVDTMSLLLREGDRLRVRATVGLEAELTECYSIAIGEGFAGKVAAEGQPLLLREGSSSPLVLSKHLRARGLKVIYGVPLQCDGRVIGVAHMGSRTAPDFSDQDRLILRSMAGRASALIVQHQLKRQLQDAVEARDSFIAVLSHDLRNPINAIGLGAGILLRSTLPEAAQRKRVLSIQNAARRAGALIDDLLQEVSLRSGKVSFRLQDVWPAALVLEAVETLAPSAQDRGLNLTHELADPAPRVSCDPNAIQRVLANLIGNAIKFTPEGGRITVRVAPLGEKVRFSVEDTGAGIEEAERHSVFERGFRGRSGATEDGLGLGLSIARQITAAHGGEIGVESEVGRGSTFWFTLPRAP